MQLSRLYSNLDNIFTPIHFNGSAAQTSLNVIFAEVKRKKAKRGDSHNLGKTTLIALIDFMLLKDITGTDHFLARHRERFAKFIFYLELELHKGGFVTIRRSVAEPTQISLVYTDQSIRNAEALPRKEYPANRGIHNAINPDTA